MNARFLASHLLVAALAFAIGWSLSGSGESPSAPLAGGDEPVVAFTEILQIQDPARRAEALVTFFDETDPSWALLLHERVTAEDSGIELDEIAETLFASWWAQDNPATAFANTIDPPYGNRHPWVRAVLQHWTRVDPVAAAEAVDTLPPGPYRGRMEAARTVLDGWFTTDHDADPTPLLAVLSELELKQRGLAAQRILRVLASEQGLDAAEAFVEGIPPNTASLAVNIRQELMARMGVVLLDYDVERAKAWAVEHGDGPLGIGIRKHLAYYWALRDGPAAMEWALSLPDTDDKQSVIKRAWISFGRRYKDEARVWMSEQTPDRVNMHIYSRFLTAVAEKDPERAVELAGRATDPEVRAQMFVAVGKGWMRGDPDAMQAWLADAEFTPELETRIRNAAQAAIRNRPGRSADGPSSDRRPG